LSLHKKQSKLFVCEFITAGGFNHVELPESLVHEGLLMRNALLRDLSELPYEIITTTDERLTKPEFVHESIVIHHYDDIWQVWDQQIRNADAVWIIAPETDDFLKKLTELAIKHQKLIFGCGSESVEITSSKYATFQLLQKAGIVTIPTFSIKNWTNGEGAWLAKPDDGAGCEDTVFFDNAEALANWMKTQHKEGSHVIQPYLAGKAASISCVMHHGNAYVLSCNTQYISSESHQLKFNGCELNGMKAHWVEFESVASKIAQALPDLAGYVGIDVLVEDEEVIVVEINPRLTTSYVGLANVIGVNPAELIINVLTEKSFPWPKLEQKVVSLIV
jgi:predicted ATP-grasp superfamily ATP-dependent carboligase